MGGTARHLRPDRAAGFGGLETRYLNDEFAIVLASEQHTERGGCLVQSFEDVEALMEAALVVSGGEPGSGFLVTVVIAEDLEPLHPRASRQQLSEVADAIGRVGGNLGYPAA